jgi:hypothetical protein
MRIKYIGFDAGHPGFKDTDTVTRFFKEDDIVVEDMDDANVLIVGNYITPSEIQRIMGFTKCIVLYIAEPILRFEMCSYAGELYMREQYHYMFGCVDNQPCKRVKFPIYYTSFNHHPDIFNDTNIYVNTCDPTTKQFATLISRHDVGNIREPIYATLANIGHIACPGPLLNNCSNELVNRIGNPEYIKQFVFNICPENFGTSHPGYITEKLMNACLGGAIPIYYGELDPLDNRIFNKERILFVNPNNLMDLHDAVKELMSDSTKLSDFYKQDVFMPGAYEVMTVEMHGAMVNMMDEIRAKLQ